MARHAERGRMGERGRETEERERGGGEMREREREREMREGGGHGRRPLSKLRRRKNLIKWA